MSAERERPSDARPAFHLPLPGQRAREDVDTELRFHIEGRIEELVAQGMPREEAEREARARFGDVARIGSEVASIDAATRRRREAGDIVESVRRDARLALRSLRRSPGFTAIAMLTLALGLGASTSIFTVLEAVVLRPLPYREPDQLVTIASQVSGAATAGKWGVSVAGYFHYLGHNRTFSEMGAYAGGDGTLLGADGAERVSVMSVTASIPRVLGMRAAIGRLITADDDRRGAPPVAVLSHALWRSRFGADPGVVGRTVTIEAQVAQVIGVLAEGSRMPADQEQADIYVPLALDPGARQENSHWLSVVGRLKDGATPEAARADLARLTAQFTELFPGAYSAAFMRNYHFAVDVTPLRDDVLGPTITRALWILFAAVGLVLLIACANVANLFLVRFEARRREVAIRSALGAERSHLATYYLAESVLLSLGAAACGLGVSYLALRLLLALAPADIPRLAGAGLGWPGVLFALGAALVTGVAFGLIPLGHTEVDVTTLREGGRGLTSSRRRNAARSALVVSQVALALVLLSSAGLLLRSFGALRGVRPGFRPEGALSFRVAVPNAKYGTFATTGAFYRELQTRLAAIPGVEAVGASTWLPLSSSGCSVVFAENEPLSPGALPKCVATPLTAPGYFRAMGIALEGRAPTWEETENGVAGAVVSRALAQHFWPSENPIGKGIKSNGQQPPYYRVVGVAEDVRAKRMDEPPAEIVYYPMKPIPGTSLWSPPGGMAFVVRTRVAHPQGLTPAIRRAVAAIDADVPVVDVRTLDHLITGSMTRVSFPMVLLGIAAGIALLLSAVGIYGVIAYVVSQRRSEIGIRMALGAGARGVVAMIMRQSFLLAAVGLVTGAALFLALGRVLATLLYGVGPRDPATVAAGAVILAAVALLASYVPARRAARVDPIIALRSE